MQISRSPCFLSQRSPLVSFFVWTAIATTKEDFKIVSEVDNLVDKFLVLLMPSDESGSRKE
jgi:hypothetical protein